MHNVIPPGHLPFKGLVEDPGGMSPKSQWVSHKPHPGPDSNIALQNLAVLVAYVAVFLCTSRKM